MKRVFGILVLAAGSVLIPPAQASDLIDSRAVLDDATGTLTIADVAGHVTAPAPPVLLLGSTNAVHWLCLRVRAPAQGNSVVLFIRPAFLNEVRLYEAGPGNPLTWKTRVTGNVYPFTDRDRRSISLGFSVDVPAGGATYYIRLKTRSLAQFSVEAVEPATAESLDHQRDLVEVFFVTAMLCLLLWALLSYALDRLRVVGLFALHQAVYTLFGIAATGYLAPWDPASLPKLVDWVNAILYLAINFTTLLFWRELFKAYKPPPALMRGLNWLLWTFPVLLVALALGFNAFAINSNAAIIKVTWLYFLVVSFSLRVEGTPRRRLVQAFFVAVLVSNVLFWFAGRSGRDAVRVSLSGMQLLIVDGLIIGGLFALIVHTRARRARQEAQEATLNLRLMQKQFQIEVELKQQAEAAAQTDDLTGQMNRRRFVELAERELARSIRFQRPFTLLAIDIDHFKSVNDSGGHIAGDMALKDVAHLIRQALREEDLFGRMGGDEFTAVIVEAEKTSAVEVAQRLCLAVAGATIMVPGRANVQVTVSIGLTRLNGRDVQFACLMNEADRAMYKAKMSGRNRVAVWEEERD